MLLITYRLHQHRHRRVKTHRLRNSYVAYVATFSHCYHQRIFIYPHAYMRTYISACPFTYPHPYIHTNLYANATLPRYTIQDKRRTCRCVWVVCSHVSKQEKACRVDRWFLPHSFRCCRPLLASRRTASNSDAVRRVLALRSEGLDEVRVPSLSCSSGTRGEQSDRSL